MVKLDSPNLPLVARANKSAPIARLFRGATQTIAPIARFDLYAHYQAPGFTPVGYSTPEPDQVGVLFRLDVGATIGSISLMQQGQRELGIVNDPLAIVPFSAWIDGTTLNLYGDPATVGQALTVKGAIASTVLSDESVAGNYATTAPAGFTIETITVAGVTFMAVANPSIPQIWEFAQVGQDCTLYGSTAQQIADFSIATLDGTGTYTLPVPTLMIATFDLSGSDIQFVDGIDFHGISFVPSLVPTNPSSGDFFWRSPRLNCFLPANLLSSIQPRSRHPHYSAKNLSVITYEGVG